MVGFPRFWKRFCNFLLVLGASGGTVFASVSAERGLRRDAPRREYFGPLFSARDKRGRAIFIDRIIDHIT